MAAVILEGAIRTEEDQYTGADGELRVDKSNYHLRLHDGSTQGGYEFLNRNAADQRYQFHSDELAGIIGFEPQQHGLVVRLGPAEYALRQITINDENLFIQYPDGYEGNPYLTLAGSITSDHEWWGEHDFHEGQVVFHDGLLGDLVGDVVGNLVGDVVGNVTGDLLGDAEGDHSGSFTGDADFRGSTIQFDDAQIPLAALNGLLAYVKANAVPNGSIIAWSGAVADVPAGWRLCNGLNGTPNLRNRFIIGAGDTYNPGASGGNTSVTPGVGSVSSAGAHTHNVSGTAATHNTGASISTTTGGVEGSARQQVASASLNDPGHTHTVSATSDSAGAHTHTVTMNSTNILPPYYALCFIMKVAS